MTTTRLPSSLDSAVERLRTHALSHEAGTFLGKESSLQVIIGVSLPTLRQAARIVEREGLLTVRRGPSGGYFCAIPDRGFIETMVGNYMRRLHADQADLMAIATVLWVEVVRKAALSHSADARSLAQRFEKKLRKLAASTPWSDIIALDRAIREGIFELIQSPYVELVFNVNTALAVRAGDIPATARESDPDYARFVEAWRQTKLIELRGIADGEPEIAIAGARRAREIFSQQVWPGTAIDTSGKPLRKDDNAPTRQ